MPRVAYKTARNGWDLEPNDRTLRALEGEGIALALTLYRPPSEINSARKIEQYRALEAELKRRTAARDRAKAVAQSYERQLAALGHDYPCPTIRPMLIHATTIGLAISICSDTA